MTLLLGDIVGDFADAFKAVDDTHPQGASRKRSYRPGIGPLTEANSVDRALQHLKGGTHSHYYRDASPKRYPTSRQQCDLVVPGEWAIEFKLLRPFGDNGAEAEHWSENVLHPYSGNVSSIGDCVKLIESGFTERLAVVVFGYEHSPPRIDITTVIASFEAIAKQVVGINLQQRSESLTLLLFMADHGRMKAYSEDLRQKRVQTVQPSKPEAARLLGISLRQVLQESRL